MTLEEIEGPNTRREGRLTLHLLCSPCRRLPAHHLPSSLLVSLAQCPPWSSFTFAFEASPPRLLLLLLLFYLPSPLWLILARSTPFAADGC